MAKFDFTPLDVSGAYAIRSFFSRDQRGFFLKPFEYAEFCQGGIEFVNSESFISSSAKNVVRGMHFQLYHPQAKLVSVLQGSVFDVLVDLREESATFGQWRGFYLSQANHMSLLIPRGCAHGFLSLEDDTLVSYMCHGAYDKDTDTGIVFDDPEIGIAWPVADADKVICSERDRSLLSFADFKDACRFTYNA